MHASPWLVLQPQVRLSRLMYNLHGVSCRPSVPLGENQSERALSPLSSPATVGIAPSHALFYCPTPSVACALKENSSKNTLKFPTGISFHFPPVVQARREERAGKGNGRMLPREGTGSDLSHRTVKGTNTPSYQKLKEYFLVMC